MSRDIGDKQIKYMYKTEHYNTPVDIFNKTLTFFSFNISAALFVLPHTLCLMGKADLMGTLNAFQFFSASHHSYCLSYHTFGTHIWRAE